MHPPLNIPLAQSGELAPRWKKNAQDRGTQEGGWGRESLPWGHAEQIRAPSTPP